MNNVEEFSRDFAALTPADQTCVRDYLAFLRWRATSAPVAAASISRPTRAWRFAFLEHFAEADIDASREPAGMEVKIAEATVGGDTRPALWQHPPVIGESTVEFHVAVPAGLRDLRLRFCIGLRDGAETKEGLVAFRVRVDGWQVWSRAAWPSRWQPFELTLPFQTGNVLRLAFATDALGSHPFAWAVWGAPELIGVEGSEE